MESSNLVETGNDVYVIRVIPECNSPIIEYDSELHCTATCDEALLAMTCLSACIKSKLESEWVKVEIIVEDSNHGMIICTRSLGMFFNGPLRKRFTITIERAKGIIVLSNVVTKEQALDATLPIQINDVLTQSVHLIPKCDVCGHHHESTVDCREKLPEPASTADSTLPEPSPKVFTSHSWF